MDYISIVTMAISVVAILVAVSFAYYAIKFHLNMRKSRSAIAMFFLMKRRTIRALSTFVMGVFVLILGRLITITISLGFLGEDAIYMLRNPVDILGGVFLLISIREMYHITRRKSAD